MNEQPIERQIYEHSFASIFRAAKYFDDHGGHSIVLHCGQDFVSVPYAIKVDFRRAEAAIKMKLVSRAFARQLSKAMIKARQLAATYDEARQIAGEINDGAFMRNNWQLVWLAYFKSGDGIEGGKKAFRADYSKTLSEEAWDTENAENGEGRHAISNRHNIGKLRTIINNAFINATKTYSAQPSAGIL